MYTSWARPRRRGYGCVPPSFVLNDRLAPDSGPVQPTKFCRSELAANDILRRHYTSALPSSPPRSILRHRDAFVTNFVSVCGNVSGKVSCVFLIRGDESVDESIALGLGKLSRLSRKPLSRRSRLSLATPAPSGPRRPNWPISVRSKHRCYDSKDGRKPDQAIWQLVPSEVSLGIAGVEYVHTLIRQSERLEALESKRPQPILRPSQIEILATRSEITRSREGVPQQWVHDEESDEQASYKNRPWTPTNKAYTNMLHLHVKPTGLVGQINVADVSRYDDAERVQFERL
ncbi:hypothetical protein EVAR_92199_1 [Eumeta japonica]|uniref:Uncharacterized protein n=1 Tax=Eumeta variegata TaxID=151549 RepID=A0A4C1TNJ4_EUMVA|nr:hypothetical protein EVAR_92199_1 [Eumeta japonica]